MTKKRHVKYYVGKSIRKHMDGKEMEKIPYGKCNFEDIRLPNCTFVQEYRKWLD